MFSYIILTKIGSSDKYLGVDIRKVNNYSEFSYTHHFPCDLERFPAYDVPSWRVHKMNIQDYFWWYTLALLYLDNVALETGIDIKCST